MIDLVRKQVPMVGRAQELATLQAVYDDLAQGRVVLLAGEAGSGKTRLITEFLAGIAAPRLVGGCVELGQAAVPFLALASALRGLDESLFEGPTAPLARLVPRMTPTGGAPAADPLALFEAVPALLDRLAGDAPAVLVVEDLHWADQSTLDAVRYLAHVGMPNRLMVLTFRTDEMRRLHPLRPVLAELGRLPQTERIDVAPLTRQEVAELARALGGQADDGVAERSEGNPFYVEELVAAEGARLPATLDEVLGNRLDALPDPARDVVDVLAVVGRSTAHGLLQELVGEKAGGLRIAIEDGVVVDDGSGYRFRHALLREAAYDRVLAGTRITLHGAVAAALQTRPELAEGGAQAAAAEIAFHAFEAGDWDTAYSASVRAAERAEAACAVTEAHVLLERAVSLRGRVADPGEPSEPELLVRAAKAAHDAGAHDLAVAHLEAALALVPREDVRLWASISRKLGEALWSAGAVDGGEGVVDGALAELGDLAIPERAELLALRGMKRIFRNDWPGARRQGLEAVEVARATGSLWAEIRALEAAGCGEAWAFEKQDAGLEHLRRAMALAQEHHELDSYVHSAANYATALEYHGHPAESDQVVGDCIEFCTEVGYAGAWLDFQRLNLAEAMLRRGDWDQAENELDRVRYAQGGLAELFRLGNYAILATFRGDVEAARRHHAAAAERASSAGESTMFRAPLLLARGRIGLLADDEQERKAAVEGMTESAEDPSVMNVLPVAAAILAERALASPEQASAALADLDGLVGVYERAIERASALPLVVQQLDRRRLLVEAERARAGGTTDPTLWRAVLDHPAESHPVADDLYAGLRLSEALLHAGEDAAEVLLSTYARARELRAWLVPDLKRLARRARVRLPGAGRDQVAETIDHGLTEREREVLGQLATGATNRQIAGVLFISEKTVSVHVSNILAKLGAANRTEAAAIARDLAARTS